MKTFWNDRSEDDDAIDDVVPLYSSIGNVLINVTHVLLLFVHCISSK